jgi:hypothetical protein
MRNPVATTHTMIRPVKRHMLKTPIIAMSKLAVERNPASIQP